MFLLIWAASSLSIAGLCAPSLLRRGTDLSSLTSAFHCVAASGMACLGASRLLNRLDELVACTQDDRALRLYATLHLTASLVLLLLSWRDWRRFGLRLTQLVVLAIFASVASVRKSVLCADSDPAFFLIFYAWSSIAFAACYRIESTLGDEDDDILDKEVKIV